jgi:hypothetical protein
MNALLMWWFLHGASLDKLPIAQPQPVPWRDEILKSLVLVEVSSQLADSTARHELRRSAVAQLKAAVNGIPSDEPGSPVTPRTR